jgi:hypothetical protein
MIPTTQMDTYICHVLYDRIYVRETILKKIGQRKATYANGPVSQESFFQ